MDREQAGARLETAIQSADHLLARYGETPYTRPDDEWLKLIAAQARELVRAASDYMDSQPCMATDFTYLNRLKGEIGQWPPTRRQQPT